MFPTRAFHGNDLALAVDAAPPQLRLRCVQARQSDQRKPYEESCARHIEFVRVLVQTAEAGTVTLAWDPNTESDLAGYLLSYGTASGQYTITIDVGNATSYQFSEPNPATRYIWRFARYNTSGTFSPYSNEVVTTPNPPLTITGLTANRMSPQSVGTSIVFTAMSTGGIAPHQFKWWIDNGGTSTIGQQWSTTNTFTWTPTVPSSTYVIRVWARNATVRRMRPIAPQQSSR